MRNNRLNGFPTSNNPPFGFNDNNFNRNTFPSNQRNWANSNGNPCGNFNQMTTNMQKNMGINKFPNSHVPNQPIIETIDYTNYNELTHNNVAPDVLDEHIIEYRINIDSLDRDISVYPDPFSFKVKFNPPSSGTVRTEILKNVQHLFDFE